MRFTGLIIIIAALVVPMPWFIALAAKHPPIALFSQYLGAAALIAMGISQFLATRSWGIESVFGGLDRIYVLHKWLAVFAIICLGLHDVVDAEIDGLGLETLIADIAEDVGEIALYGLLILVFVTVTTFIPYHLWRWSHRFIGLFYILSVFHFIFILKPFDLYDPVGLYILTFCSIGVFSYLYMLLAYGRLPRPARYKVSQIDRFSDGAEIVLTATARGIRHDAGQFAFVQFELPGLGEIHPFTISGSPQENREIRFSIKGLGGYTSSLLQKVQIGTVSKVFGPFGRFNRPKRKTPQIWIGAGIGITPFLSWARNLDQESVSHIHLYYCVRDVDNAPFVQELKSLFSNHPSSTLTLVDSKVDGRLSASGIVKDAGPDFAQANVFYCGPVSMRETLRKDLKTAGLSGSRFHFEHFEIRTDVGFMVIFAKIAKFALMFTRSSP